MKAPTLAPLVMFALGVLGGVARADAVPPPPVDCPLGAIGVTGHNGPYCTSLHCSDVGPCPFDDPYDKRARKCADFPICVEERTEPSQSGWSHGKPFTMIVALGPCGPGGTCEKGKCETGLHCVLADAKVPEPATKPPAEGGEHESGGHESGGNESGGHEGTAAPATAAGTAAHGEKKGGGCGCSAAPNDATWLFAGLVSIALLKRRRLAGGHR